ncbi:MAG TPA: hypothetical protein VEW66_06050 [Thermomicrobiales bacterium]|nr:hypothetical protein [Thermomicrobiales bacterium]
MTDVVRGSAHPRLGRLSMCWMLALMVSLLFSPIVSAQDATETPEDSNVMVPGTGDAEDSGTPAVPEVTDEEAVPTEEPEMATTVEGGLIGTDPGSPAVIAHGLAYRSGSQVVWQVREVSPADAAEAEAETSNAALVYQVSGSSVIRNSVTGKRALLNVGDAYFKAGGDPYTTMANSTGSLIWVFEVVGATDVASDAFYESPLIDDYSEGVYDLQFVRYVLAPGDSADLPQHNGPTLVMSTNGDVDVEGESIALLSTGDGQLVNGDATVVNNSQSPVEYGVVMFGDEVSDASAAAPNPSTPAAVPDDAQGSAETPAPSDEALPGEPVPEVTTEPSDTGVGGNQESINIVANAELYVVVVADGVTVFDGPIPAGGQSGEIIGSTFEVYTSNGGQTLFVNSCGEEFFMGYETGEARYTLTADGTSCIGE